MYCNFFLENIFIKTIVLTFQIFWNVKLISFDIPYFLYSTLSWYL